MSYKDVYCVTEITQNVEQKFLVQKLVEVESGVKYYFKRSGELCHVTVPHDYEMTRTKHPGFWRGAVFGNYCWQIGKRRESQVAVNMYGLSMRYPIDEINEIERNGLYAKGMADNRNTGSVPKWLIAVGLAVVLLVGGVCATKQLSSSDDKEDQILDMNGNGIPDIYEDLNGNGIPDIYDIKEAS